MQELVIDLYGGDRTPRELFPGLWDALALAPELVMHVILRREDEADFAQSLQAWEKDQGLQAVEVRSHVQVHAGDFSVLTNCDNPMKAASPGASYTITEAFSCLQQRECGCLLSVGNTAAVLILSLAKTGLKDGVTKPVLASFLPRYDSNMLCLLDCGANLDPSPEDLLLFARLGAESMRTMYETANPSVALLSVGKEKGKGMAVLKKAYDLLEESPLSFYGNAEPDDLYLPGDHAPDVVVCDGFSGNMILKNIEATGMYLERSFRDMMKKSEYSDAVTMAVDTAWQNLMPYYSFNDLGGAVLLGTKKPAVKAHGKANATTIYNCIRQCMRLMA